MIPTAYRTWERPLFQPEYGISGQPLLSPRLPFTSLRFDAPGRGRKSGIIA